MLKFFRKWICGKPEVIFGSTAEPPESSRKVHFSQIKSDLNTKFPQAMLLLSDSMYALCAKEDIERFLLVDETDRMKYERNDLDCDDFAFRLMGQFSVPGWSSLAFGILWTERHAINCFIDDQSRFWIIEPQTDKLLSDVPAEWGKVICIFV